MQLLVEPKTDPGGSSDELDGAVVMRRAEAAGDDAEVGVHPFGERAGQLVLPVADDRDPRGLDSAAQELGRQKGTVQIRAVASDELAAGDDDEGARGRDHTAARMPRGVTTNVFTPPTGSGWVRPLRIVTRFSGRSSVIQSFRPVKSCFCPWSSVP